MHNLYTNFVRILEVCKQFSEDLVNDKLNTPMPIWVLYENNKFTRFNDTSFEKQHSHAESKPNFHYCKKIIESKRENSRKTDYLCS
jgi:hypothetical protein